MKLHEVWRCPQCEGEGSYEEYMRGHAPMIDQPVREVTCPRCMGLGHLGWMDCTMCSEDVYYEETHSVIDGDLFCQKCDPSGGGRV